MITHGPTTGLIYTVAHKKNTKDMHLLVYRTGVENVRTLVKVILIEENCEIDSTSTPTITAGGSDDIDFIFL